MDKIELLNKIKRYNNSYRLGSPEVTDAEYDALVAELASIDPSNEWFKHIEPSPVSNSRKRKLPIPMKSLDKVNSINGVRSWLQANNINEKATVVVMPKFDGLSLLYDEREEIAYSRGGSENEGQDCSAHFDMGEYDTCNFFPYTFGELVFTVKNWETIFANRQNDKGEVYKSPRNTIAGLLNRDEPSALLKYATFYRYGTDLDSMCNSFANYSELLDNFTTNLYQQPLYHTTTANKLSEEMLMEYFIDWRKLFYIDGLVIYINNVQDWVRLGRRNSGNPRYAIAYKHPDFTESFETTVKSITWKANKVGALKPVVNIDAVDTGDCIMENPTGYNASWLADRHIAPSAKILVTRSGGVIPKILETIVPANIDEERDMWDDLTACPHCGSPTAWSGSRVELMCTNPQCSGVRLANIVFFYTTLGAEDLGESTLAAIFNKGFTQINQFLNIQPKDLFSIEGFGPATIDNFIAQNDKIKEGVDIALLMQASNCFPNIGPAKSKEILGLLYDDEIELLLQGKLKEVNCHLTPNSRMLEIFLYNLKDFNTFMETTQLVATYNPPQVNLNGKCAGMRVCVSGFRDAELERHIIEEGGAVVSGVSKKTTHLVVLDVSLLSSKISKAKDLNIPIIDKDSFTFMYKL